MTNEPDPHQSGAEQDAIAPPTMPFPQAPPIPADYGYGQGQYAGRPLPPGMYLDQESGLFLPNGVQLASRGRRIGAFFLSIPLFILTLGIGYAVWGLIVWRNGQTPTLQVLGMRCWQPEDQRVPGFWWMALREVVERIATSILLIGIASFILMMARQDRKTIHDLAAGTVVLRDPNGVLSR